MESTLSIVWQELQARVGGFLGWGRGAVYGDTAWSNTQQFELDGIVASGLRQFYYPPPIEGELHSYNWSFLAPVATFTLASGDSTLQLPDDFGGFEGNVTLLSTGTAVVPWEIQWTNEGAIRQAFSVSPSATGPPRLAAEPLPKKGTTHDAGQRFLMEVYPIADRQYNLQAKYYVNPDYLTGSFPYPYGAAQHSETIMESCLALAEQRLDDQSMVHSQKFHERLLASISIDRRLKPMRLGPNRDHSDDMDNRVNPHWYAGPSTYNGSSW